MRDKRMYTNYKELYSEENSKPVEDLATEETVEPVSVTPSILTGTVSRCEMLNLRSEPRNDVDNVIMTLALGNKVKIFTNNSTDDYYYVELDKDHSLERVNAGGYVMKRYIDLD